MSFISGIKKYVILKRLNDLMNKKIIIYELNEVPRRLIDTYIKDYPSSAIAEIVKNGISQYFYN